jgi:multisubunit Na+/H+ antiporter MnhB subunit
LSPLLLVGPAVLAVGSLLMGVEVNLFVTPVIDPSIDHEFKLALFAGFNIPLFLSLTAFPSGLMLFTTRAIWRRAKAPPLPSAAQMYQAVLSGAQRMGDLVLRAQAGKLRYYLIVILLTMSLLMSTAGLTHVTEQTWTFEFNGSTDVLKTVLLVFALGAMLASILFKRHLIAALCLGVGGYSIGGVFLLEPAPDVALVQFLVETLGTVLLIIMLAKINAPARQRAMNNLWAGSRSGIVRDIAISATVGVGVTLFALAAVLNRPAAPTITLWHLDNALPQLGFPDIVGAIVTDFRGMDTMIEITVFGMAALGVLTLLTKAEAGPNLPTRSLRALRSLHWRIFRAGARIEGDELLKQEMGTPNVDNGAAPAVQHSRPLQDLAQDVPLGSQFSTPLTRTIAKLVLPFALLLALAQLLYGGDGPGDGFTAGVTSGLGVALWYIVFGYHETRQRLTWLRPRRLIGIGIGLVVLNAALPLLFGYPFLAHLSLKVPLPADLHMSSTLIFEIGIFLTVFGSSSIVMEAIAHPKDVEEG